MLTLPEALARILTNVAVQPAELVGLRDLPGRVLAAEVISPRDVPPFDNSAMDGYAVRASDTAPGEVTLALNEVIGAGDVGQIAVQPGTASGIMTGAPVPEGADTVVMVEHTDGSREGEVRVRGLARMGQHIRRRGEDVAAGDVVLFPGQVMTAGKVGLAASLGFASLQVRRKPVVSVMSTGDEVVLPGTPLGPGQIYSSNNFSLCALVEQAGGVARDCGNAPDDLDGLVARLREAIEGADVVLTTGGVSVGAFDYVKEAHQQVGADVDFWKVRMKPGKPLAFGRVRSGERTVPLFGLPGNPVSCMVNFYQFVRPWLRTSLGDPTPFLPMVPATAAHDFGGKSGRLRLERVLLSRQEDGWVATSTGSQSSGVLTSMALAHGLLAIDIDEPSPAKGDRVRVQLLDPGFLNGEVVGL